MEKNLKYKIIRIDEPDFGCEGLPDGEILKDDLLVEDEHGNKTILKISDALLYSLALNEGDYCCIDENNNIYKLN